MGELIRVPLTGEVKDYNIDAAVLDGIGVSGNPDNPVRPVRVPAGINIAWKLITIDLDNDEAVIEINPPLRRAILKPGGDPEKAEDYTKRDTTAQEKQAEINKAKSHFEKPNAQIYAEAGESELIKRPEHTEKYRQFKKMQSNEYTGHY